MRTGETQRLLADNKFSSSCSTADYGSSNHTGNFCSSYNDKGKEKIMCDLICQCPVLADESLEVLYDLFMHNLSGLSEMCIRRKILQMTRPHKILRAFDQ